MTLSNFDWTDKNSVRWFLMLPTGHEGPYSLELLEQRLIKGRVSEGLSIWAEGLENPVTIGDALKRAVMVEEEAAPDEQLPEEELPPPLPFTESPSTPDEALAAASLPSTRPSLVVSKRTVMAFGFGLGLLVMLVLLQSWVGSQEKVQLKRQAKMDMQLHEKIQQDMEFGGWDKPIFFKEYVPNDLSLVWLVSGSFQTCEVEASFESVEGNLLTMQDEKVMFKSRARLSGHLVEFSAFEFSSGTKILPGLYDVELKAHNCQWDGLAPKLGNRFKSPETSYAARQKMILYPKGAAEFHEVMEKISRKRQEIEQKLLGQEEIFWTDLQLKLDTLLAVTLQIENLFLELFQQDPKLFQPQFKSVVQEYMTKHGRFLTDFVVANENYFRELGDLKNISLKKNYEGRLKATALRIGFETMKYIEEFQALKKVPGKPELNRYSERMKETFKLLKHEINQKIIQSAEDRSS
jgi:hypothetical protein